MKNFNRVLLVLAFGGALQANVKLPALISDHMILQQDSPVCIWGRSEPGETVSVNFQDQAVSTKADANGRWKLYLKPMKAGRPSGMIVSGENTIVVADVLVGEVWIGSGQSNMGVTVARANNPDQEIAQATYPMIRLFQVKLTVAEEPAEDVEGKWQLCSPESVRNFSAIGYFFSREIHQTRRVPVGFIQSAWGGTPAESWTSRPSLQAEPSLARVFTEWNQVLANYPAAKERYDKQLAMWKLARERQKPDSDSAATPPRAPAGPGHQNTPGGLFNAMIAPLTPFAMRGVLWYQGENNANKGHAYEYRRLFQVMIEDWRRAFGQGNFPFLFVQLANFGKPGPNSYWPALREAQTMALNLRGTGMAVTIDIGEHDDIHPRNKQDVGHRLALAARHMAYAEPIEYSGPLFRQAATEGDRVRIWFDHVGAGLETSGAAGLTGFAIAGKDKHFVPAEARIDGSSVVVSSPDIREPVAIRYAWEADPVCNLTNKDGLPASPFRTDDWRDEK